MNFSAKKFLGAGAAWFLAVLAASAQTAANLGNLPLWFEAGQNDSATSFVARGRDSEISISAGSVQFTLRQDAQQTAKARMEFIGANSTAEILGAAEMSGKINYLIGNDSSHWQSGIPTFGQVRVEKIYPGINLVYYGNQQRLEYDFDLAPGATPQTIAIRFAGADKVSVDARGELVVSLAGREIVQHQPVAYQISSGVRREIQVGYKVVGANTVAFSVGNYDSHLPLVIDPILSYSTFFGGNNNETAWAVALDAQTNVYIAGQTLSSAVSNSVPFSTTNAFQAKYKGGSQLGDAFIAKFDASGTNLIYCTYLGGNNDDAAYALAVDAAGHAFVGGVTDSTNFPVLNAVGAGTNISGVIDPNVGVYPFDGFVAELETNGSSLIFSTYLGGKGYDAIFALALDGSDNVYVTGYTTSTNFPVTANAFQTNFQFTLASPYYLNANAFVSEIAAGGNTLNYSSYLGGTNYDVGRAIAYNNGYVAVAGYTTSTNFPTINAIAQTFSTTNNYNGRLLNQTTNILSNNSQRKDAFVTEFLTTTENSISTLTTLPQYSTLLGGTNDDIANGVAVDASGNAYVVGSTTSSTFPVTTNGCQLYSYVRTNTPGFSATNAFFSQIQWNGSSATVGYSQMFGGGQIDLAHAVALDAADNVFIVGSASSLTNYSATITNLAGSLTWTNRGASDICITAFKSDFSGLLYAADLGSSANDSGYSIAVDGADSIYITGQTLASASSSIKFPTFNAYQATPPDANNAFLAKIWLTVPTMPALTSSLSGTNVLVSWPLVPFVQYTTNTLGLQTATNLINPKWTTVTQNPALVGGTNYIYTFRPTAPAQFFRFYQK